MSFTVTRNTLTPEMARMARECGRPRKVLEAMGTTLASTTQRAFNDASLRPAPWAPVKKQGGAPLKRSGALWHSIRVTELTDSLTKVGTDRKYAGWLQYGTSPYTILPKDKKALFWPGALHPVKKVNHPGLPPRPFFPFDVNGRMTPKAIERVRQAAMRAIRAICRERG